MAEVSARKRIWGWMMFDWATQPFYTLLLTFVFGPYFAAVATQFFMDSGMTEAVADARAQSVWSLGQTVTGLLIAFTAPLLGAFADSTGRRMPWIVAFSVVYVVGTSALWWMVPDGSAIWISLMAFGLGMIGAEYATIFTNALLPSLGHDGTIGRISGTGAALGYAGGVIALFIMLLLFAESDHGKTLIGLNPAFGLDADMREGTRAVGPFTAIWYILFMVPFFLWVRDERTPKRGASLGGAVSDLKQSLASILRLALRAQSERSPVARLADRVGSVFVVAVLAVAAVNFLVWWWIAPERAIWTTLSVLVATCPCALGLALPAVTAATTR